MNKDFFKKLMNYNILSPLDELILSFDNVYTFRLKESNLYTLIIKINSNEIYSLIFSKQFETPLYIIKTNLENGEESVESANEEIRNKIKSVYLFMKLLDENNC